ncbi:uncharacterized protein LOC134811375 [Bolinopsis microptera]|uniref:uncharacterized protein LOC134811375 n=1 Tax=Bolinopsis microptera TaxID=2820187 RepID=UPI003078AC7B
MAISCIRLIALVTLLLGISQASTSWFTPSFTDTANKDGIYWHRSDLAYRMGENFQPTMNIAWGSTPQYTGMFLQGNLQFFLADSVYIGITNLFQVAPGGLHVSALRGAEDFYIDVPGCGSQRFTKSVFHLNIGVIGSFAVTWNIESHASSSCPELFGAIQFPTKEASVDKYFTIHYRIDKWEAGYPGKRAVGGFVRPFGGGDMMCYADDDDFVIGVMNGFHG